MSEFASIEQLWKVHMSRPFPRALAGEEIDGQDVALLDSLAAGCISTFLGRRGAHSLDAGQLQVLGDCVQSLALICPQLPDENRAYFDTLREVSERVFRFCRRDRDDDTAT
jgi:hypothetical protein